MIVETSDAYTNIVQGNNAQREILKATVDIGMGLLMGFYPIGTVIGGSYIAYDVFIGW